LFVGMGMSWRRLLDAAVTLTDHRLHGSPLGCVGASTATDRAGSVALA
jgi:hypothetical protein